MNTTDFLSQLQGVKNNGNGQYMALCPGHSDHEPSLSVKEADGKILLRCFGGCGLGDILKPLGLEAKDLFLDSHKTDLEHKEIEAIYHYIDANGKSFEVVRTCPKGFYQRQPDGEGGYINNLKGIVPTLYHRDELKGAIDDGTPILVVEGEKDVDGLRALGMVATCNPMGAGKWRDRYSDDLKGAKVAIIADKDAPGRAHAQSIAASVHGKAASIKVLELPDMDGHEVKDASDWLAAGGTVTELERFGSEGLEWTPPSTKPSSSFKLTRLSDLLAEPTEEVAYVWQNTLSKAGLSILVAKPKVGKSTLSRNLALKVARGDAEFLGRAITASGPVVYLALEEKRSEVKKHFERMGARKDLPIFIHVGSAPEKAIEELRRVIIESKAVLAVVDPLQRLARVPDLNDYSLVSLALEPIMQIARETGCHILLIHHANKGIGREGGDSILGSTAIFGSVDCALVMKRSESCRTLESLQRYGEDLPRTVLAFDAVTGVTSSGGSLEDVEIAECGKAILGVLDHEMTEAEIKEGIGSGQHGNALTSKALRKFVEQGKIEKQGAGKKGDPYRYSAKILGLLGVTIPIHLENLEPPPNVKDVVEID